MAALQPVVSEIKEKVAQGPVQKQETLQHYLAENSPTATRETALGRVISIWKQQITPTPPHHHHHHLHGQPNPGRP